MHNYQQYKETDITTADRGKLVVMLYDGAINFLKQAKTGIEEESVGEKCENINKASDIIHELQCSLRFDIGGDIAQNLNRLYQFMITHLIKAKISQNGHAKIDDVISMLQTLNEAWRKIQTSPDVHHIKEADFSTRKGFSSGIAV